MMLDRGPLKDWFGSTEMWVEATIAAVAFYLFVVHIADRARASVREPGLFNDRNFVTGNIFIFVVGVVLFATLALLPPLLQEQMGYPVFLTGLVTAPRGIGTLLAMVIVGRLIGRVPIALSHSLRACQLTGVLAVADDGLLAADGRRPVVWSGVIQGFGTGLRLRADGGGRHFATLTAQLRNEAPRCSI